MMTPPHHRIIFFIIVVIVPSNGVCNRITVIFLPGGGFSLARRSIIFVRCTSIVAVAVVVVVVIVNTIIMLPFLVGCPLSPFIVRVLVGHIMGRPLSSLTHLLSLLVLSIVFDAARLKGTTRHTYTRHTQREQRKIQSDTNCHTKKEKFPAHWKKIIPSKLYYSKSFCFVGLESLSNSLSLSNKGYRNTLVRYALWLLL